MDKKYKGVRSHGASIEINFSYLGETRFERIALSPTPTNLRYASRLRGEIINKIDIGEFNYIEEFPNSKTARHIYKTSGGNRLDDKLNEWLEFKKKFVRYSTFKDYEKSVAHLCKKWGHLYPIELKRSMIKKWLISLGISQKRANNLLIPIRSVYKDLYEDELISRDPFFGWKPEMPDKSGNSEVDPFERKEMDAIIDNCPHAAARWHFQAAFWSGMRTSEQIAITWSDNLEEVIKIDKGRVDQVVSGPKTISGYREILKLPKLAEAIHNMREITGWSGKEIFCDPRTNKAWKNDSAIRKYFMMVCKRADVRYRKPYNTRHTFASMMLTSGENHKWIANILGHKDLNTFYRVYGKLIKNKNIKHGKKAHKFFAE